jgi:hypothetical protein
LRVERDAETSASVVFELMQAKDKRIFKNAEDEEFRLAQMPEDMYVEVDSHSSSPAFIDDAREWVSRECTAAAKCQPRLVVARGHKAGDRPSALENDQFFACAADLVEESGSVCADAEEQLVTGPGWHPIDRPSPVARSWTCR